MRNLLGLSEAAALALHTAAYLVSRPGERLPSAALAKEFCVSHAHLTKVIQRLARSGVVQTFRGPGGGVSLSPEGPTMSLLQVIEAVEGPLRPATCLLGHPRCPLGACVLGGIMQELNRAVWDRLNTAKVAHLNDGFEEAFQGGA